MEGGWRSDQFASGCANVTSSCEQDGATPQEWPCSAEFDNFRADLLQPVRSNVQSYVMRRFL